MRPTLRRNLVSWLTLFGLIVSVLAAQASSVAESEKKIEQQAAVKSEPSEKKSSQAQTIEARVDANVAPELDSKKAENEPEPTKRQARAESSAGKTSETAQAASSEQSSAAADQSGKIGAEAADKKEKAGEKEAAEKQKAADASKQANAKSKQKSATKSKLPANLGTVTSTGSGSAHYMSKHDAYSAIAEKHGALAQNAMRKSDKRRTQTGFGGIQKASGFGDVLSPFKGVTDSGLARTLGASMRSIMKSKYSVPAYVASALLGAVALMAFYESPISPLPVPPLPEPPVGRFPPEMPNISPNVQVPFRGNQQQYNQMQNYNQRSLNPSNQQQQQVLFPGNSNNQAFQQRQLSAGPGPVQQLAANLLSSVGKQQTAQRKSSPDYDLSSSRSFFGGNPQTNQKMATGPANQHKQSSFLSYFGLGGAAQASSGAADSSQQMSSNQMGANVQQASGSQASLIESKGQNQANVLSNSHLVNKVKSFFSRSPVSPASSSSGAGVSNANPFEQYQRMSFVQAFMKDAAFLPSFLTPTRKSSTGPQQTNRIASLTSALVSGSGSSPAARMSPVDATQSGQAPAAKSKSVGSGYGVVRAADRIAHALLETFTSGMARNAQSGSSQSEGAARKSNDESSDHSLASATTSLLSDIMTSYSSFGQQSQQQAQEQPALVKSNQQSSSTSSSSSNQSAPKVEASGRSSETQGAISTPEEEKKQDLSVKSASPASSSPSESQASSNQHSRKTRSVGFEYPIESNVELTQREQQPSKASQINNLVDFVADSYTQNRLLFNFVMNQVGLSHAVPYVEQILASGNDIHH